MLYCFSEPVVCCLHGDKDGYIDGKITTFNEQSLHKCRKVLETRKQQLLKYAEVALPENISSGKGYHMPCYRKFVALSKAQREKLKANCHKEEENSGNRVPPRVTRSDVLLPKSNNMTGVFQAVCLFCGKGRQKVQDLEKTLINVETKNFEENVRKYAVIASDEEMLARIASVDFTAKEVRYHSICRKNYQKAAETNINKVEENKEQGNKTYWHLERMVYTKAFDALVSFVEVNIIEREEVHLLANINQHYRALVRDIGGRRVQRG